ncbi:N-methylhydantoinase A [Natronobacterium gregoryi]|uniref:5-oxoprolinase (ATP-hydrolyzing) n=3 Tax=Natronobacterium gregoryi TaxID=44930 RepID=L0AI29_NATGS|nr:hydantoinase/oxoprolinase family protein [Natronobacterium gregoryi]AFZ73466.1 N-methylhydantoinase A/acetone carboxylase, beta subunit [Natronobacterium gregoryi SP2]ELY68663.1 5-oxoprolinase (ATP-hydrolyzing) [Natronobacterium gregoryi SP2]PLK20518.1 hydantoinase/oxoprolinase family protein [Natronobacterium gregoryi SP2]SFI71320.1 N-methylhydantoinase A [Natronobacterium gregoryi]
MNDTNDTDSQQDISTTSMNGENQPNDTRIGVDVGGTFTDVALSVDDRLVTAKVPTTDDQSVGVLEGIHKACERGGIDPGEIDDFAHAMTVSVNALLERGGAKTALVTTAGFRDVLEIGRQDRPDLYDLEAKKPDPLVPRELRFEVDERTTDEGVESEADPDDVRALAATIQERDVEAVAVCLLHAYADTENERVVAETLREELEVPVSASHEVLAEFREFERTSTTAVDAYVRPAIDSYVGRLVDEADDAGIPAPRIMQANGGIADPETVREHAVTTTMSGPAAGVVGAAATVSDDDVSGLVTFDMGGTSSDVSLVRDGQAERTTDAEIAGLPIRTPMVDVNTVGAGGGSIAWADAGGALRVGPQSSGAEPGPACYGKGGTNPTVTDANVVLGYIGPETELGGELTLDVEAAHTALEKLADEVGLEGALEAAQGVYRVANATMTRTIRSVTVERGHDPREFALVAFGGAGPMHAAALADALAVDRVVVPRPGGVLSAFGLLAADESYDAVRTVGVGLEEAEPESLEDVYDDLVADVLGDVSEPDAATVERAADCRYAGQSFELTVPVDDSFDASAVAERFHASHERAYGYAMDEAIEVVNLRTTATVPGTEPTVRHEGEGDALVGTREAHFPGTGPRETTVYERDRLAPGVTISGPAILEQAESTTVVPPTWAGEILTDGTLVMTREGVDDR